MTNEADTVEFSASWGMGGLSMNSSTKTWFLTGASTGLGKELAREALAQGHIVAGTFRKVEQRDAFEATAPGRALGFLMDVTQPAEVRETLAKVEAKTGRLDVVVNNAGYGLLAALEETPDDKLLQNITTNLIGPLQVMRAAIPILRRGGGGHIINISAIAAFSNELGFSVYGGAKAGLEAASDAVAGEVAPFKIRVTVVIPGPVRTDFIGRSLDPVPRMPEYVPTVGRFEAFLNQINGRQPGDPAKIAQAIVSIAGTDSPPSRLVLGTFANDKFAKKLGQLTAELDRWRSVGQPTDFAPK
jgi:NAD(P)-dependent dehydrogenase (short-subunit alcohol dehydrogenase family)